MRNDTSVWVKAVWPDFLSPQEMALELVCWTDLWCNRHCKASPVDLEIWRGFGAKCGIATRAPRIGNRPFWTSGSPELHGAFRTIRSHFGLSRVSLHSTVLLSLCIAVLFNLYVAVRVRVRAVTAAPCLTPSWETRWSWRRRRSALCIRVPFATSH